MEIKDGSCRWRYPGLMSVVPAAPHYQGHWHEDQLRYAKCSIAFKMTMGPLHQYCTHCHPNYCKRHITNILYCVFLILTHFSSKTQSMWFCMTIVATCLYSIQCIFLLGYGWDMSNIWFILSQIFIFFMHQQRWICNFICLIYELPPNLIWFSNINITVILQCSATITNLPYSLKIRT